MSSVRLIDGRVLHFPDYDALKVEGDIPVAEDGDLAACVPLIPSCELLLFTGRLVSSARKRRRQPRWAEVNAARLRLARLCIDRALSEWDSVQEVTQ